jgi:hypothetical protein
VSVQDPLVWQVISFLNEMSLPKPASRSPEEILVPLTLTGRKPDLRHDGRDLEELFPRKRIFTLSLDEVVDGDQDTDSDKTVG